eukprot:6211734-Pleurochrysis_carterae.AAC.6
MVSFRYCQGASTDQTIHTCWFAAASSSAADGVQTPSRWRPRKHAAPSTPTSARTQPLRTRAAYSVKSTQSFDTVRSLAAASLRTLA